HTRIFIRRSDAGRQKQDRAREKPPSPHAYPLCGVPAPDNISPLPLAGEGKGVRGCCSSVIAAELSGSITNPPSPPAPPVIPWLDGRWRAPLTSKARARAARNRPAAPRARTIPFPNGTIGGSPHEPGSD